MKRDIKNKEGLPAGRQSGFVQLIILIVVALLVMKYFHVSVSDIVNWFKTTFASVLR